ncbi:MAG TPA: triose-phosphate isomerase [Chlamydiales bacterium]|nr:triose-phosphate isomerase [Chlamydiales bacterium]
MLPYVIGNWKMYKTEQQAVQYVEELLPLVRECGAHLMLAVPYTAIHPVAQCEREGKLAVGAQNMHDAREGAFTGEIAASMLKEAGATFVLIGHSERRRLFHESLEVIHKKILAAFREEILPILCVGETLEEKEAGKEREVLREQLFSALEGVHLERSDQLLIAYEPVWAIGTGKTAEPNQVGETHAYLRSLLSERFGEVLSQEIAILYGGSVQVQSAETLMGEKEVNGLLVGGASLDPKTFAAIAACCVKIRKHS